MESFSDETQEIIDRTLESINREMQRSKEKLFRSQKNVERRIEHAINRRKKSEIFRERNTFQRTQSHKNEEVLDSISDDEQLYILCMLEEKKITVDQAEMLLSSLENNES